MLGAAAWIYNLPPEIYRVRAVRDENEPGRANTRAASRVSQLHEIVCTVYEIAGVTPVIDTE